MVLLTYRNSEWNAVDFKPGFRVFLHYIIIELLFLPFYFSFIYLLLPLLNKLKVWDTQSIFISLTPIFCIYSTFPFHPPPYSLLLPFFSQIWILFLWLIWQYFKDSNEIYIKCCILLLFVGLLLSLGFCVYWQIEYFFF